MYSKKKVGDAVKARHRGTYLLWYLLPTAYRLLLTAHRSPLQARHPDTPFIMYIAKSAALLERMAATGERGHTYTILLAILGMARVSIDSHSKQSHRWTHHSPGRPRNSHPRT